MKDKTLEPPVQRKPVAGGAESRVPVENPWYSEPRLAHDPKHMSPFVSRQSGPFASGQNPTKPPLEKERQLCYFFFSRVFKKKKKKVLVPSSPSLLQKRKLTTEEGAGTRQIPARSVLGVATA